MPRRSSFCGREMRHSGWWPDYVVRLFRRARARFTDDHTHERLVVDGKVERLREPILHEAIVDLDQMLGKMNAVLDLVRPHAPRPQCARRRARRDHAWSMDVLPHVRAACRISGRPRRFHPCRRERRGLVLSVSEAHADAGGEGGDEDGSHHYHLQPPRCAAGSAGRLRRAGQRQLRAAGRRRRLGAAHSPAGRGLRYPCTLPREAYLAGGSRLPRGRGAQPRACRDPRRLHRVQRRRLHSAAVFRRPPSKSRGTWIFPVRQSHTAECRFHREGASRPACGSQVVDGAMAFRMAASATSIARYRSFIFRTAHGADAIPGAGTA